jgi:hypothetical protein
VRDEFDDFNPRDLAEIDDALDESLLAHVADAPDAPEDADIAPEQAIARKQAALLRDRRAR